MSLDLIRNRPQFNLDVLKPGVAIKYKYNETFSVFKNAIIIESKLSALRVMEYSDTINKINDNVWLYLDDMLDDKLDIKILK